MLRFGTAGIRETVGEELTPEAIVEVARAAAAEGSDFAIARDGRATSPQLLEAAAAGLASGGADVERLGLLPTPALAYASRGRHGLMVTASHNPPSANGIKLFVDGREIDEATERRIEARVRERPDVARWDAWGQFRTGEVLGRYRRAVETYLEPVGANPTDVLVVVDSGTGTAGLVVPEVLRHTGATVRSINGIVDGTFPARPSKPTAQTLGTLRGFVANGPADLGLAFDGDADRIVVVDAEGDVIHEDTVLAIVAAFYVDRATETDPVVVTTPNASERIDERVRAAGGRTVRTPLGALQMGIERVRANAGADTRVVFAAEPWKHLHPAFGGWIDAIVSAGLLLKLVGASSLDGLREPVTERPLLKESVPCAESHKGPLMRELESVLPSAFPEADVAHTDGIRLTLPEDDWILARPSGTESKFRLYVESEDADRLLADVRTLIEDTLESVDGS